MEYQITKILIISFFSSILISLFLNTRYIIFFKKFSKNKKILLNLFIYSISSLTLIFINYLLSLNGLTCLLYTSPSPRDAHESRMPSSA